MNSTLKIQRTTFGWTDVTNKQTPIPQEETYYRDGRGMMAYHLDPNNKASTWWTNALRQSLPEYGIHLYHTAFLETAITLPGINPKIWEHIATRAI